MSEGEKILISGPSGSGKTTFLKLAGGIFFPNKGDIQVGNISTSEIQKKRFSLFGYAFVDPDFFESMNIRDNILVLSEMLTIRIDTNWYEELLSYFEMKKYENTLVSDLSAGQRERVNIIRALVHKPKILLLDEPGSHLDRVLEKKLVEFIKRYYNETNTTLIISSHGEFENSFFDTFIDFHENHSISVRKRENTHQ